MRKQLIVLMFLSILLISIFSFAFVLAEKGSNNGNGNSNSGSSSNSGSNSGSSANSGSGNSESDSSTNSGDSQIGNSGQSSKTTSSNSGSGKDTEVKIESKKTFVDSHGNENEVEIKIEETESKKVLKVKSESKTEKVETELEIEEEDDGQEVKLKIKTKSGQETEIKILPSQAKKIALDSLDASEVTNITLEEKVHKNVPRVVYNIQTNKNGKFLGVWKIAMRFTSEVDPETGEIIEENKPWWSVLVAELVETTICHVDELDENKRTTIVIPLTELSIHLAHGDTESECVAECGDGIIVTGIEICESEDILECTTIEGYSGKQNCNLSCDGFNDLCITEESCGDNIVNGNEECDDGNILSGDGCDITCKIEVIEIPETNQTEPIGNETGQNLTA